MSLCFTLCKKKRVKRSKEGKVLFWHCFIGATKGERSKEIFGFFFSELQNKRKINCASVSCFEVDIVLVLRYI